MGIALSQSVFSIPLFPLSSHILPGGRMSLRIFEPRYIRMVKEVCANSAGFGICMLNVKGQKDDNTHFYPIGTYVEVIDFELLDDGLLGVTVAAQRCFEVLSTVTEADGLRVADVRWCDPWHGDVGSDEVNAMRQRLGEIFDAYPELAKLYGKPAFEDPGWILLRWLELLPVKAEQKQQFLRNSNYNEVLDYITQIIQ